MSSPEKHTGDAVCVDMDGTLLRTDVLHEAVLALLRTHPLLFLILPFWLMRGKAHFKRQLALHVSLSVDTLPYDRRVLEYLEKTPRRPRVLCTASDQLLARPIAAYLGCFEEVLASDGRTNLAGRTKAAALVEQFGERGFEYMGNGVTDLHVWKRAQSAWVVSAPRSLAVAASRVTELANHLPQQDGSLRTWLLAIRLHQWLKNLLVFVPLLAAHRFTDAVAAGQALAAFVAFGLCASGVYVLNDMLDLEADRRHPRKRLRPFAAGNLRLVHGMAAAPILTLAGFAVAWWLAPALLPVLAFYYGTTLAYSLRLKQVHMLDVMLLAGLYTIRIIGGAVAVGVPLSFWLLAFSMFVFLSLAMLKRYTELSGLVADGRREASGRGYSGEDLTLLQALGGAAGYLSVLVLALYINSPESLALYSQPQALWLLCPLLLYWISRAWSLVQRGRMHDDPLVFAFSDRVSLAIGALFVLVIVVAI